MAGFYENITVSAAVPSAAADAEAAKDAAVIAKDEALAAKVAAEAAQTLAEDHKNDAHGDAVSALSSKGGAKTFMDSAEGYKDDAEDARDLALAYRQAANISAQAASSSANSVSANAATVAGMADDINLVAGLQNTLITVAFDLGFGNTMSTIRPYMNQIDTVSGITTEVIAVAADAPDIGTVATDLTGSNNIGTVAGLAPKINTVAGLGSELNSVHDNNADITTVATSLNAGNTIANVSSSIGNVNSVGNKLAEIEAVKNALSDIVAVEDKLTEIDNVSDSITNVDSVAGVISEVQKVAGVSDEVANLSKSTGNMATLVSKLDQTNDLAGAVTDAQNSATSASGSASTAATQATAASGSASTAATHAANLGSVAYQNLTAIAQEKAVTAVDVFVYDTSKDSDGGAWRNRTQGTSWYNEALNTSIRGATKKFPAVAVIVLEGAKLTIYDADDPSMPMWMVFDMTGGASWTTSNMLWTQGGHTSVTALNGTIFTTNISNSGMQTAEFIADQGYIGGTNANLNGFYGGNIGQRNDSLGVLGCAPRSNYLIVNNDANDVAVTVLPNAPIDPDTGLPVPTIAVATDGGVSVIKDDGSVVSGSEVNPSWAVRLIEFDKYNNIWASIGNNASFGHVRLLAKAPYDTVGDIGVQTATNEGFNRGNPAVVTNMDKDPDNHVYLLDGGMRDLAATPNGITVAQTDGLSQTLYNRGDIRKSLANHITSSYNTGWMNGDIKLATLMDTTAETISAPELVTNGDFSNGTTGWTAPVANSEVTLSNGQLTLMSGQASNTYLDQDLSGGGANPLVAGKTYAVSFNLISEVGSGLPYVRLGGNDIAGHGSYGIGQNTVYFKYAGGSADLRFMTYALDNNGFTIDNVSVTEVVADRSVNNNGLNIVGNVTKSAVATGAELVSYDVGSANNYLTASNFDFPNYDCSVMFWVGDSGSDRNVLFLGDPTSTNPTTGVNIWVYGSRVKSFWGGQDVYGVNGELDGGRHFVCFVRKGNTVSLYVDGKYVNKNAVPITNAISATDLAIGKGHYNSGLGCEDLALLRISATAPTPEQIAKIYRDEKPLFQEGAKCTLDYSSSSVTALDYDEDTELLHAGTASAVSTFKGLQRIKTEASALGTAISASNDLVIWE